MFGLNDPFFSSSMFNNFMFDPFAPLMGRSNQNSSSSNSNSNNNPNNNANNINNFNNNNAGGFNNNRSNPNQMLLRNGNNAHQQLHQQHHQQQQQLHHNHHAQLFDPFQNMMMSPFERHNSLMAQHQSSFNNPFALMNQMMSQVANVFTQFEQTPNIVHADPNTQVFSSTSVMSYSNTGDGKPKIYQASTQVTQAPGGVKETRKMLRDSEKGIEKVAIGHHIGDRAHIIEREKRNGGQIEEVVNLENLDDNEVPEFNSEFENKLLNTMRSSHHHNHHHHHRNQHLGNSNQPFAIEDGASSRIRKDRDRKSKSKSKH